MNKVQSFKLLLAGPEDMLKILDWYIIKKLVTTTIFIVIIFSVIASVVDWSEKADDFVKSGQSAYYILTHYFAGFVAFIISLIFPLMVFIAVILFTSKMAGRTEIVAMLAGGVKFTRILRPYLIGSIFLAALFWYATQYLIPKANVQRANFQATYVDAKSSYEVGQYLAKGTNVYIRVDSNTYAGLRNYDTTSKAAYGGFFLDRLRGTDVIYNMRAQTIKWDTSVKKWRVERVMERHIDGMKEEIKSIANTNIDLNVKPNDIRFDKYLKDKMTTPELKKYIMLEEMRGSEGLNDYKVERFRRDATPVSVILLTLMGAVVASRKTRGGSGLHMAVGIILAAVFVVMDKFSLTFSTKGNLHPFVAAWMPNIIFTMVAIYLYRRAPK
jgi:lipopolysaccharide export system permease protein